MKRIRFLVVWVMVAALTSVMSAAVVFDETCENLNNWTGLNMNLMSADGQFHLSAGNGDNNVLMYTVNGFTTSNDFTLSFDNFSFGTGWNFGSTATVCMGNSSWGTGLGVAIASYGDAGGQYYYNGTAHSFASNLSPDGIYGNIAMTIQYFAETQRLLITQISGTYWNGTSHQAADNIVLVDAIMAEAYDYASYDRVLYTANTQWNGGGSGTIDNIVLDVVTVPEPMTMALVALGGLGLLRRKK